MVREAMCRVGNLNSLLSATFAHDPETALGGKASWWGPSLEYIKP